MASASDIVLPRDRDAWGTIRGYVYQVDLTIERWLDLQPGQILELERGEDIDLISRALVAEGEEQQRLLEQVKHRDAPVTLRSASAVGAVVSAVEHLRANPDQTLLFRYTTNTYVGRDRPSTIHGGLPAIAAWEQVRLGTIDAALEQPVVDSILTMLRNTSRPEGLREETWSTFRDFIGAAGYDELVALIRRFEWSTGGPAAAHIGEQIRDKIIARGHATGAQDAEAIYQRLFLYVFKLLTQPGIKQLTPESLAVQLTQPTLNEADHALLRQLASLFEQLDTRVSELEQASARIISVISNMSTQVQQLAAENRINAEVDYRTSTPILDVPPLPTHLSHREETVAMLTDLVSTHTWTAVYGGAGFGKTHLTLLVVDALGGGASWLSLRDLDAAQASILLDAACKVLADSPMPSGGREAWYQRICERLGRGALIVLDDLPRLSGNDELSNRLLLLVGACRASGVKLLSTSGYQLPVRLQTSLGEHVLRSLEIPSFSNGDALEILQSFGAPASVLNSKSIGFINGLARRHPMLLMGIARYLDQHDWTFTDEALAGLFAGNFTAEINDETLRALLQNVEDPASRELLYRASLSTGTFTMDDARALAQVEPAIERPGERMAALTGLWVQHQVEARLLVSPLISAFGSGELAPQTRKHCHRVLGDRIVQKGTMNQIDVQTALPHFLQAEEFDRAGVLLLVALNSMHEIETPVPDAGLLSLWSQLPLPEQMDRGLRIYLRALQIAERHKRNLEVDYLVNDLDLLLRDVTENDAWAILPAIVLTPTDIVDTGRYLPLALRLLPGARLPGGEPFTWPDEFKLESLIWLGLGSIFTPHDLREWVRSLEELTPQQREQAFADHVSESGSIVVADRLWLQESDKPEEDQQWDAILEALTDLRERARELDVELLWAAAVRALIIVLAEYRHDLTAAVALGEASLNEASADARVQFLIRLTVGKQYLYAGREEEAIAWLSQALDLPTEAFPYEHLVGLVDLSRAIGDKDPASALEYIQQAVNLGRSYEEIPETELIKTLGELAIGHWLGGDMHASFTALSEGGERLFASRGEIETDAWKSLFVIFGHVCGYITSVVRLGEAPDATPDGVPYIAPKRGMLFTVSPQRAASYDRSRDCFLMAQLSMLAEAVGEYESAARWAARGLDLARAANQTLAIPALATGTLPYLLENDRYAEVLDAALEAAPIYVATWKAGQEGRDLPLVYDVSEALGPRPNHWWQQAERSAALTSLLPIVFRLGTLLISDPAGTKRQGAEVAGLCREISATAAEPTLWRAAAELLDAFFDPGSSFESLMAKGTEFGKNGYPVLHVMSYLGATLQADAIPEKAVQAQASIMGYVHDNLRSLSSMYERVIIAFLVGYWENAFQKAPCRFRTPKQFGESLATAVSSPLERRAEAILESVANGLGVRITSIGKAPSGT
jgi:tetratricopeptide (TPR) repeat protein